MNADLPLPHPGAPVASTISTADALNRACFCFSLDQDALAQALDSEIGQPGLSLMVRERCPYLFAAQPVFVVTTQLQRMAQVMQEIESSTAPKAIRPTTKARSTKIRYVIYAGLYDAVLAQAELAHPVAQPNAKRGRTKQSKAVNLIGRLRQYSDDVWRFMTQANVPFTNNLAEQAVRMPKVKQKVSGCFRTAEGSHTYCVIRSYVATMQKQGGDVFAALVSTFKGRVPQPNFGGGAYACFSRSE